MVRLFRHYISKSVLLLGFSEALILFGSLYLGVHVPLFGFNPTADLVAGGIWPKALAYAGLMLLMLSLTGLYQRSLRESFRSIALRLVVAFGAGIGVITVACTLLPGLSIGRQAALVALACSFVGIAVLRWAIWQFFRDNLFNRRVLVLGAGEMAMQIENLRRKADWSDMELVGYLPVGDEISKVSPERILTSERGLLALVMECGVDELVVAVGDDVAGFPVEQVIDSKLAGVHVLDLMTFFERATGKMNIAAVTPRALALADGFSHAVLKGFVHRCFDVVVSVIALMLFAPFMLVTAVATAIESKGRGAIFYRQVRVGLHGRNFAILKFRSMREDAEAGGAQFASTDDDRTTRVGRFIRRYRIDELPQFLNVLQGEMSIVGPRPERPQFVKELAEVIPFFNLRHSVKPGITGWAQISYPYGADFKDAREKLQYDLYYIKNYSLFLDLTIMLQTAQVMLWGKGGR